MDSSRYIAQPHFSGAGKHALVTTGPQPIVFQIYSFNLVCRYQIGPVCADKPVSQLNLQFAQTAQKIDSTVGCVEEDMVWGGGGFKKEDIA